MQLAKTIILWLAFIFACFLPAPALTLTAPENCIWEIFSIGYDAATAEVTDLESRTETSTSNYDTAPVHVAITEEIPTEANHTLFGQTAEFKAAEGTGAFAPVGRIGGSIVTKDGSVGVIGGELKVTPGTNTSTTINGIDYSGHALDQMQGRGLVPSVIENTIKNGQVFPTRAGTTGYFDPVNNVRVIVNSQTGKVVTAIPGAQ